jgi:hypothetical protein
MSRVVNKGERRAQGTQFATWSTPHTSKLGDATNGQVNLFFALSSHVGMSSLSRMRLGYAIHPACCLSLGTHI